MKVIIFTNDHQVREKRVRAHKLWFNFRGKLYDIDATAILMDEHAFKEKPTKPRLIYYENSSEPLRFQKASKPDPSTRYQEKYVRISNLRNTSKPSLRSRIGPYLELIAGLFTLENLIIFIIAGSMLWTTLETWGIV